MGRVQKELRELEEKLEEFAARPMDIEQINKDIDVSPVALKPLNHYTPRP